MAQVVQAGGPYGSVAVIPNPLLESIHVAFVADAGDAKVVPLPKPSATNDGYEVSVSDSTGTAGNFPITISAWNATIGGQAEYRISAPYGAVTLVSVAAANDWSIKGRG